VATQLCYKGRAPAIKKQIVDMSLNGSGIRDTARVLQISPTTTMNTFEFIPIKPSAARV
jgi:insertion element IS1 protein InsB